MRKVELHLDPVGEGQVVVGGVDISDGVRGITVHAAQGHLTTVTLDLAVLDVTTFAAEAEVLIPGATRDTLVALGWTPPPDPAVA